jgi:hypothetical protein
MYTVKLTNVRHRAKGRTYHYCVLYVPLTATTIGQAVAEMDAVESAYDADGYELVVS